MLRGASLSPPARPRRRDPRLCCSAATGVGTGLHFDAPQASQPSRPPLRVSLEPCSRGSTRPAGDPHSRPRSHEADGRHATACTGVVSFGVQFCSSGRMSSVASRCRCIPLIPRSRSRLTADRTGARDGYDACTSAHATRGWVGGWVDPAPPLQPLRGGIRRMGRTGACAATWCLQSVTPAACDCIDSFDGQV